MAAATEANEAALQERLAAAQATTPPKAPAEVATYVAAASAAVKYVELDEAETRELVDEQLRQAGWEADSTSASTMRWRRQCAGDDPGAARVEPAAAPVADAHRRADEGESGGRSRGAGCTGPHFQARRRWLRAAESDF